VRRLLASYGAAQAGMALALLAGWLGPVSGAVPVAGALLLAALLAARSVCQIGTAHRIDVSGTGELRLTVQQTTGQTSGAMLMRLETGSTLWPRLLCLSLLGDDGRRVLLIAPDSVTPDEFRALAVALRSIARRDNIFFEKNKIV
jgi:toxin CptA